MIDAGLLFSQAPSLQAVASGMPTDRSQDRSSQERKPALFFKWLCSLVQRMPALRAVRLQTKPRRLRLQEIVQLGDKRFVAILRVDGQEFLLGGSTNALALLGTLSPEAEPRSFAASLAQAQSCQAQSSQGQSSQVQP